jgi:hypothetical protein
LLLHLDELDGAGADVQPKELFRRSEQRPDIKIQQLFERQFHNPMT